jgi:hypothetical protein
MIGPNLSDWSLKHRSFLAMISIVVAGLSSYFRLGRSEDPAFTFRTMIVQAACPGATLDDTLTQVIPWRAGVPLLAVTYRHLPVSRAHGRVDCARNTASCLASKNGNEWVRFH